MLRFCYSVGVHGFAFHVDSFIQFMATYQVPHVNRVFCGLPYITMAVYDLDAFNCQKFSRELTSLTPYLSFGSLNRPPRGIRDEASWSLWCQNNETTSKVNMLKSLLSWRRTTRVKGTVRYKLFKAYGTLQPTVQPWKTLHTEYNEHFSMTIILTQFTRNEQNQLINFFNSASFVYGGVTQCKFHGHILGGNKRLCVLKTNKSVV